MRRKKTKRSGTSFVLILAAIVPLCGAAKKKAPEAYGMVVGTIFRDPGYALPGADVSLTPNPESDGLPVKVKKMQSVSDARGEFVFRVPAATMRYTLKVAARGYAGEEKSVTVHGEERVDVTFSLHEESK